MKNRNHVPFSTGSPQLKNRIHTFLDRHFSGESIGYPQVIAIFLPVLVDQSFVVVMNLINTAMISSSGVAAVSAVNMVDSLSIFLVQVFIAVSTGGTVVVAQYKGSGNEKMVSKAAAGSVSSVFLFALGISLFVLFLHGPTLKVLFGQAEPDVFRNAKTYLIGCGFSYCGIAVEEAVCGALRGVGNTKSSLALSLTMNLSYVVMNLVLINVLHMGVLGMVISLNVSRYLAAGCAIFYITRLDSSVHFHLPDVFRFDPVMLKRIFFVGLPFAAEQMFFNGGKLLTQTFVVGLGTYALAANAICASIGGLLQVPATAMCLAVITVVGQCMGRRDVQDARKFVRSFRAAGSVSMLAISCIILPLYYPLVGLFHPPAVIVPVILRILLIDIVALFFLWPGAFIIPSALRAAGDSKYTSMMSMLSMWLCRVVLGYLLGIVFHMGITGVWVAMFIEWGSRATIFGLRFRGDKWYRHRLID